MKPILAITVGDYNGIGPEIILKALRSRRLRAAACPVLVGPLAVFAWYATRLKLPCKAAGVSLSVPRDELRKLCQRGIIPVIEPASTMTPEIHPGELSADAGRIAAAAIWTAVEAARRNTVAGVVTAPVSKKALHLAGIDFPGQTEMVQNRSGGKHVAMMLVSPSLRVGLATIHIPVEQIHGQLTRKLLRKRIEVVHNALRTDWRISRPRIAVLGLNPHAGESGDMGAEEQEVIIPVMRSLRRKHIVLEGPFPADAFFAHYVPGSYDAVIAMYHDQGLIPLKMTANGSGVNVSAGLSIIRTSPDHGTAFDIAGRGIADPRSMVEACCLASLFVHNRSRRTAHRPL